MQNILGGADLAHKPYNFAEDLGAVSTDSKAQAAPPAPPPTEGGNWKEKIVSTVLNNPYFHAGAGLYTLTFAAFFGRFFMMMAKVAFKRRFVVSLETTSRDPSYEWLMQWFANNQSFNFQQMSLITSNVIIHANEEVSSTCTFAPCPNVPHWMFYNGWPLLVFRKRQVDRAVGSDVLEQLEISTFGNNSNIMHKIVEEARLLAAQKDSDKTVIYHNAGGRWTRHQDARSRRPLESVILDGDMSREMVEDVRVFLDSRDYYTNLGVPYRRGYLLHGPPGCGKSSFVMALAGELRLAICVLSLSNRSLDDESLNNLLNTAPLRSIVLMEDIDRAFTNDSRVTMSGLLNALDGVAAQEGRIVFMTTNHVEMLDSALIRPGRADIKKEISYLSRRQCKDLFTKFFPGASESDRARFSAAIPEHQISAAQIQSHLFLHRDSVEKAVSQAPDFVRSVCSFEEHVQHQREMAMKVKMRQQPPGQFL